MCNYYATKWKREHINDHNFDFIDISDFKDYNWNTQFSYFLVVLLVMKSVLIYIADIWTALVLLEVIKSKSVLIGENKILRYVFFASIVCSFLILIWDTRKSYRIMQSRDIAFAFTDTISYNLYSLKSYSYYCLFHRIENSKNTRDMVTFFIFFRLKRWKRIILAEAPRQVVNGLNLWKAFIQTKNKQTYVDWSVFGGSFMDRVSYSLILVSFGLFVVSALAVISALIMYVPLVCQIQGNLKEYVCHKIDKRVARMLQAKSKRRALENRTNQEQPNFNTNTKGRKSIKNGPIRPISKPVLPRPTLPSIAIPEDESYEVEYGKPVTARQSIDGQRKFSSVKSSKSSNHPSISYNFYDGPQTNPPVNSTDAVALNEVRSYRGEHRYTSSTSSANDTSFRTQAGLSPVASPQHGRYSPNRPTSTTLASRPSGPRSFSPAGSASTGSVSSTAQLLRPTSPSFQYPPGSVFPGFKNGDKNRPAHF